MTDWLAVGDETGNWDELNNPGAFLGAALVIGRIEDWQAALNEEIDGQPIRQRLQGLPRHLPPAYHQSRLHHLLDTFKCWETQKLAGEWSLDAPGDDPLRREVFTTLRWLAEHPRLITVGLWFKGAALQRELFRSGDPAVALGRVYGLLAALVLPFLNSSDRLLVNPGLRTEKPNTPAKQRATVVKDQQDPDSRTYGDTRSMISVLIDEGNTHRDACRGSRIAGLEAGTLVHLRNGSPPLKKAGLPNDILNAIADLGAGLLRLTCQSKAEWLSLRRDPAWANVVFHALPELTE